MSEFRREYKATQKAKVQVIGAKGDRPRVRPYLRVEKNGDYVCSLDGRGLYALRNALNEALASEADND